MALADTELVGVEDGADVEDAEVVAEAEAAGEASGEGCDGDMDHELSARPRAVAAEAAVNRRVMEMMASPHRC
ncbi:hypothetical protein RF641_02010 [Arthrobacter sp. LS16]|uniref:hypothetical protein n=1 Tax=Arthrobacter sp. 'calajunan' TaxID=1690248 RepID=UPI003C721BC3